MIETSYLNLDPIVLEFKFPGPIISVNGDQDIVVPQGTQSGDLYFSVAYPSRLSLKFVPTFIGNITIHPQIVTFPLIATTSSFRVEVPQSLKVGTYKIIWNTLGELELPFYTAIKLT